MGFFSKVWKGVKKTVKKVARGIKKVAKKVVTSLPGGKALWKAGTKIGGKIMEGIGKLGPLGVMAISFVLPMLGPVLAPLWSGLGATLTGMATTGGTIMGALGKAGLAVFNGANFVGSTLGAMGDAMSQGLSKITKPLTDMGGKMLSSLKEQFPDVTAKLTKMSDKVFGETVKDSVTTGGTEAAGQSVMDDATSSLFSDAGGSEALGQSAIDYEQLSLGEKMKLGADSGGLTKAVKTAKKVGDVVQKFLPKQEEGAQMQMSAPVIPTMPTLPAVQAPTGLAAVTAAGSNLYEQLIQQAQMNRGGFP